MGQKLGQKRNSTEALNVALIFVSAVAAYLAPVELFLFAYGVLGPLHYLSELSWLHDRGYFLPAGRRRQAGLPVLFATLAAVLCFGVLFPSALFAAGAVAVAMAASAFCVAALGSWPARCMALAGMGFLVWTVPQDPVGLVFLTLLVPTLVHVFFFTLSFVAAGAKKRKDPWSWAALLLLLALGTALLLAPTPPLLPLGAYAAAAYLPFQGLNAQMLSMVTGTVLSGPMSSPMESAGASGVMRFIAFAYTYHYLNWFSKTRVIGWSRISPARGFAIFFLWLAAVGLYLYDYALGAQVLWLLSFGHVLLELPLNAATLMELAGMPVDKGRDEQRRD